MFSSFSCVKDKVVKNVYSKTEIYLNKLKNEIGSNITVRDIALANAYDKNKINSLKDKINEEDLIMIEEMNERFDEVKGTEEWKELVEVEERLADYENSKKVLSLLSDGINDVVYREYYQKNKQLAEANKYFEFYEECKNFVEEYLEKYNALIVVNYLSRSIERFSDYLEKNPLKILGRTVR